MKAAGYEGGDAPSGSPREDALAWLRNTELDQEAEWLVQPYVDAAAVLSAFQLSLLQPAGKPHAGERMDALMELTNRCIVVGDPRADVWQLQESCRRVALRRLGSRSRMRAAREANPRPAVDPVQQAFDKLIQAKGVPAIEKLSLEELLGMEQVVRWLDGVVAQLPSRDELASRIAREQQLAPIRKIAEGFVDRKPNREDLADYVGTLPPGQLWRGLRRGFKYVAYRMDQRPPLHLHGPGGIGKSALLARFILDHTRPDDNPHPLPFVYLDFDRASLDPARPDTLLEESIRQLLIQFPAAELGLESLGDEAREQSARFDGVEISKSSAFDAHENLVRRFCRVLELIASSNDQPVLMVLDTLEEAEYQGLSAMLVTWDLLADLLRRVDRLRIVTAGRSALPSELKREPVELLGLPLDAAVDLIIQRTGSDPNGPVSREDAQAIVGMVGTVPLSLALASQVVLNEGVIGLRYAVSRHRMFSKIKAEQQQGMLHRRILNHVRMHDLELWKVANPGLVVRRITVDIIEEVLAEPCGLALPDRHTANQLFHQLAREVGLMDPYREPGALWHLPAVRRIMLPDLLATLGELPQAIHAAAAGYYRGKPGTIERAEEIYHRLWLDEDADTLDALWSTELEPYLRGTLEEFKPRARIWLADKLGVELPTELREQAEDDVWERQTERRVRTLLGRNLLVEALAAVRERDRLQHPSPLHALEADIQKLMGDTAAAFATLTEGLGIAERAGDAGARLQMVLRLMFLHEAADDLVTAWPQALLALELAQTVHDPLQFLSAAAAVLRLKRKVEAKGLDKQGARALGHVVEQRAFETFTKGVHQAVLALTHSNEVRVDLRSRPSLHTEVAAELGEDNLELLLEAISQRGITPEDLLALRDYAAQSLQKEQVLPAWVYDADTSRGIGRQVAELVPVIPGFFTERLRLTVEDSLTRTVNPRGATASPERSTGPDPYQMASLTELVTMRFSPRDLELLVRDSFDQSLDDISSPGASHRQRASDLLHYAAQRGWLPQLIDRLADSHRDDDDLLRLSARRQRR